MATAEIPASRKDDAPAKSPESQMDTLRRVIPEMVAGSLKGSTTDLLGLPVDLINSALGAVGMKSKKPVGGADSLREMLGIKSTEEDTAAEIGGSFLSPAGASKAMIVGIGRVLKKDGLAPEAITRIMKTASDAKALEMAGLKAQIFNATGAFTKNTDNVVRGVISDEKSRVSLYGITHNDANNTIINSKQASKLEDLLIHDELFALYPELKNYRVRNNPELGKNEARHYPATRVMEFGETSGDNLRSNILHETQHAIQTIEGMQAGGQTKEFLKIKRRPEPEKLMELRTIAGSENPAVADPAKRFLKVLNDDMRQAYQKYLDIPGETEARLTQETANLPQKDLNSKIYNLISDDTPGSLWAK